MQYLGIEIGGTKLQLGIGPGDGTLASLWRETVNVAAGPEGIRQQIVRALSELLRHAQLERHQLGGIGIGFGGPVDDATQTIIKSHQIAGWDNFPLAEWVHEVVGLPAVLGNDADCAGLAEALFGAGQGLSPVFYITIGSGIGGGLILNGEIHRGTGRGAAEIGHLKFPATEEDEPSLSSCYVTLEEVASGWGIEKRVRRYFKSHRDQPSLLLQLVDGQVDKITAKHVGQAIERRDPVAQSLFERSLVCLAEAICHVIALVCPRRIVIGGGVSLMGDEVVFQPLRCLVAERVFKPFAGLTDIVPASLGEVVVVHGALALARQKLAGG
jgi:glucokinase